MKFSNISKIFLLFYFFYSIIACSSGMQVERNNLGNQVTKRSKEYHIYSFGEKQGKTVVIFSPVFWKDEILFDHNQSLISYFVSQEYQVFLISISSINWKDRTGYEAMKELQEGGFLVNYTIAGVSIGGLRLLETLNNWSTEINLPKKVFFLGTGFDYNYKSSFANRNLTQNNNPISSLFLDPDLISYWVSKKSYAIPQKSSFKIPYSLPIAFFWGKIDSVSPYESIYPVYETLPHPKVYKELSIANGLSIDYDHGSLFKSSNAYREIFPLIVEWLEK
jgi:hypothetical protein